MLYHADVMSMHLPPGGLPTGAAPPQAAPRGQAPVRIAPVTTLRREITRSNYYNGGQQFGSRGGHGHDKLTSADASYGAPATCMKTSNTSYPYQRSGSGSLQAGLSVNPSPVTDTRGRGVSNAHGTSGKVDGGMQINSRSGWKIRDDAVPLSSDKAGVGGMSPARSFPTTGLQVPRSASFGAPAGANIGLLPSDVLVPPADGFRLSARLAPALVDRPPSQAPTGGHSLRTMHPMDSSAAAACAVPITFRRMLEAAPLRPLPVAPPPGPPSEDRTFMTAAAAAAPLGPTVSAPHGGVLYPPAAEPLSGPEAGGRRADVAEDVGGEDWALRQLVALQSSAWQPQRWGMPPPSGLRTGHGEDGGSGEAAEVLFQRQLGLTQAMQLQRLPQQEVYLQQERQQGQQQQRRSDRRRLGSEEFLHQYDGLIQEQAAAAAAAKPRARRSKKRKPRATGEVDAADAASDSAAPVTLAAAAPAAPASSAAACDALLAPELHEGPSNNELHGSNQECGPDAAGVDKAAAAAVPRATHGRAGRRPKLLSQYNEFELAQGAALGRMPPGSGRSAWDQMRATAGAAAPASGSFLAGVAAAGSRSRRKSSGGGGRAAAAAAAAELLTAERDLEEPWAPEEKAQFWRHVCGDDYDDESHCFDSEAGSGEDGIRGTFGSGDARRRALLSLSGTPVLICVRQPDPYGAAEVYELPDLGLGPMDEVAWQAWGRLPDSSRPAQPLMRIEAGAGLGFELCPPAGRGAGGWRTYEVVVGPGYSHDPGRTLHPLRLVCGGRVLFDARHVWDLVDFLADPTWAGVAAHLTSAALLRTGRDREVYHPPSFCHWLLLRRWGARGLAHVGWGPADTLAHVSAVRRWSRPLAREAEKEVVGGGSVAAGPRGRGRRHLGVLA